jgi:hypothetical protein
MLAADLLTPQSSVLTKKLTVVHLVKKFPASYGTRSTAINKYNVCERISTLPHFTEVFKRKGMLVALKVNYKTSIIRTPLV